MVVVVVIGVRKMVPLSCGLLSIRKKLSIFRSAGWLIVMMMKTT